MDLVNHLDGRLLFAIPKKGRLQQATLDLLAGSDVNFRRDHRLDIALVKELPIALVFLPAADIPTFVGEGKVNLGITGWDQVAEHEAATPPRENASVTKVLNLGFGACKLQVQVPENGTIQHPKELIGKNVVTSFVNLARSYFEQLELEDSGQIEDQIEETRSARPLRTRIRYVGGSVEAACALGVADGIVDLVESGETMRAAGLKPIDTVVSSTAVLIKSRRPALPGNEKMVELITERIKGVITAQKYVLCQYNIQRSALAAGTKITPGKRAPTINSLDQEGWAAVSSMVEKDKIAKAMDELTLVGAKDILVLNIMNSRI